MNEFATVFPEMADLPRAQLALLCTCCIRVFWVLGVSLGQRSNQSFIAARAAG